MILPDHPTPIRIRTHSIDPVPFMIYSSEREREGVDHFNELTAISTGNYVSDGYNLMGILTEK